MTDQTQPNADPQPPPSRDELLATIEDRLQRQIQLARDQQYPPLLDIQNEVVDLCRRVQQIDDEAPVDARTLERITSLQRQLELSLASRRQETRAGLEALGRGRSCLEAYRR